MNRQQRRAQKHQLFDEMGLHLNFEEPFDRIEKVEKKR